MINVDRPGRFRLAQAPLMQALAQVQFPLIAHLETLPGVAGLQDALLNDLPYMQQMPLQEFSLVVGPAGVAAPQSAQRTVTRFTNDDQWALEVQAGSATLTAPGETYDGSAHFGEVFGHVVEALYASVAGLRRCDRIGVRYVNVAPVLEHDAWTTWFRPELVGWAQPDLLAPDATVRAAITESRALRRLGGVFEEAQAEAIVRHGLVPPGTVLPGNPPRPLDTVAFVLDVDLFVAQPQVWNAGALAKEYEMLHGEIEKFFFWALTDEGQKHFGLEWVTE
jgi:uncharacterized protein (TIGR04255 family)